MTITVLQATDYNDVDRNGNYYRVTRENTWLTKTIYPDGSKSNISFPKRFRLGECYEPDNLEQLLPVLNKLEQDPKCLVIRHKYRDFKPGNIVERKANLVSNQTSHIIAMDIDDLKLPKGMSRTNIREQGEYVALLLHKSDPEKFPDDMGFIAQGSSSAGLSNTIKLHMWIRNTHKLNQSQLRNLFYHVNARYKDKFDTTTNLVDPALYHDVQAHYTAYPIFQNPKQNPLKEDRTVYVYGNSAFIPKSYAPYVKPVETTEIERGKYLKSILGSSNKSLELEQRIDRVKSWKPQTQGLRIAVIAVYHTAIQDQYDLDLLESELKPILDVLRPGQGSEYIRQGIVSSVNNVKACSVRDLPFKCLNIPLSTIESGKHERYLDIQKSIPKDSVTFLKASLGSGKTHSIAHWLKTGAITGKFLALTDTSALVESNAARFNAGDFRNAKDRLDFASGRVDRLSGTLHSLLKIRSFARSFDFLFIDEADSLMNNLLFARIISEEDKIQIIEVLSELLKYTDRVVISDGDISEETVNQYIQLMEGSRELYRINHQRETLKGVTAYKHETENSLWGAVQGHLELGDKCLVVSDSSPKALNEYLLSFERVLPDKKVKVVHSSSKMDSDIEDIVNNTTHALNRQQVDALFCSPSITNGVDFNYFDVVFVLTTTENHTPNMRFQAMMRERHPSTIHYYFKNMKSYHTGYSTVTLDQGFTVKARKAYAARREREYKTYIATFNYYLIEAGAKIEVIDVPYASPKEAIDKENYLIERVDAILKATKTFVIPRHNDAFEKQELIKFFLDVEELSWDDVESFVTNKPDEKAEFFHLIYPIFKNELISADSRKFWKSLQEKGHLYYLATGDALNGIKREFSGIARAKRIMKRCGIVDGDTASVDALLKWYRKYCEYTSGVTLPEELREEDYEHARELL